MANQLSQVKWVRVVITALVVFVLGLLATILLVTVYAGYLAFQVRGAPDQEMINAFASTNAPWLSSIFLVLFTFFGARHAARRVESAALTNGLAVGVLVGLGHALSNLSSIFDLNALPVAILAIGAGWLGGKLVRK